MNNQTIQLAKSIAVRISATVITKLSSIEKDILLEDLRKLYRAVEASNVDADDEQPFSEPLRQVSKLQNELEPEREMLSTVQEAVAPPSVEESNILPEISLSEPPVPSVEIVAEGIELPIDKVSTQQEATRIEEPKRFSASVGIGGEEVKPSTPTSLNEVFMREESSINSSASSNAVRELHSVVASSSFSGLLDLNKRIHFTKELFNDNSETFNIFLQQIERCKSMEEAKSLVNTTALSKSWKIEHDAVRQLVGLVRQHFEFR